MRSSPPLAKAAVSILETPSTRFEIAHAFDADFRFYVRGALARPPPMASPELPPVLERPSLSTITSDPSSIGSDQGAAPHHVLIVEVSRLRVPRPAHAAVLMPFPGLRDQSQDSRQAAQEAGHRGGHRMRRSAGARPDHRGRIALFHVPRNPARRRDA